MSELICKDIFEVFVYLRQAVCIGGASAVAAGLISRAVTGKWNWRVSAKWFLFCTYLVVLVQVALLSREPGSRTAADLIPFSTWGKTKQSRAYVVENFIMFLPMGIMIPMIGRIWKRLRCAFPTLVMFSLCIETVQYITQRGYFQTDDIIMNTLGGIAGFLIWKIGVRLVRCK